MIARSQSPVRRWARRSIRITHLPFLFPNAPGRTVTTVGRQIDPKRPLPAEALPNRSASGESSGLAGRRQKTGRVGPAGCACVDQRRGMRRGVALGPAGARERATPVTQHRCDPDHRLLLLSPRGRRAAAHRQGRLYRNATRIIRPSGAAVNPPARGKTPYDGKTGFRDAAHLRWRWGSRAGEACYSDVSPAHGAGVRVEPNGQAARRAEGFDG